MLGRAVEPRAGRPPGSQELDITLGLDQLSLSFYSLPLARRGSPPVLPGTVAFPLEVPLLTVVEAGDVGLVLPRT